MDDTFTPPPDEQSPVSCPSIDEPPPLPAGVPIAAGAEGSPEEGNLAEAPFLRHRIGFDGRAGEYFRIWGVNLFLTVITCGIYAAWAKVRTRRYFYAHTRLGGLPFDYLAEPGTILKGNLVVAGGVILYSTTNHLNPKIAPLVALLFALAVPFLIYKSLRFFARNTSYRNLRCRFHGGLAECYRLYLLMPVLLPLTLGLIMPYWAYRRQRYFFANLTYGDQRAEVTVRAKAFYRWYGVAFLLSVISLGCGAGIGAAVAWAWSASPMAAGLTDQAELHKKVMVGIVAACGYGAFLLAFTAVGQYLKARTMNCFLNNTALGRLRFESNISARRLAWIQVTNFLAMIFCLGLLVPWATVRRRSYLLESITVIEPDCELDRFAADASQPESALGEAATDFFDLDIGF